jgi:polyketide cyclase/dehydrase/lipid transport protein
MLPILLALVFIAIIFFVVIAGRPDEFVVLRSIKISAPPGKVFPHVNDLHKWQAWSPWAKLDPKAKNSFAGADSGTGAAMSWDGNKKIGAGRMTITGSEANELIRFKLEFIRPFQATDSAEFTFKPEDHQTVVTWSMTGKNNFFFKVFGLLINFDKKVGGDFEKGLVSLKAVAETATGK